MNTNYAGHDSAYQKRFERGEIGWDNAEGYAHFQTIVMETFATHHVPTCGTLVELGCGAGNISLWLAEQGYTVAGMDIAPTAIRMAQQQAASRGIQADFIVGNVVNSDAFAANSFDIALDGHCLHCIIGDDRFGFLSNARRIVKPGGYLFIATMCGEVKTPEMRAAFDPSSRCLIHGDIATRYIGQPDQILREIERAGFHLADWEIRIDDDGCDDLLVMAQKAM